jgi:DNA-binding MarR family transcriptional regulator
MSRDTLIGEVMSHLDALVAYRRRSFCKAPVMRDVSLPQLHILMGLQEQGPTMVSELAEWLGISTPSASSIVDRMEHHGLVRRVRDEDDRRVVYVTVTDRGAATVEEMIGVHRGEASRLFGAMTDEELLHVAHAFTAVQRVLNAASPPPETAPTDRRDPSSSCDRPA